MATNKNITMKQFNGTDYDTLYPKTVASQIPDVFSKTETVNAEMLSKYGLGASGTPNDVFGVLSRFNSGLGNEYLWERHKEVVNETLTNLATETLVNGSDSSESVTIYYSDEVVISAPNNWSLKNPTTLSVSYNGYTKANVLAGKYYSNWKSNTSTPSSGNSALRKGSATGTATRDASSGYKVYFPSQFVTAISIGVTPSEYFNSPDPSAYPPAVSDGYVYNSLGQLGSASHIEVISYVGTGTVGSNNPTSLTFKMPPKLFLIQVGKENVAYSNFLVARNIDRGDSISGSSYYSNNITWTNLGKTVSWYCTGGWGGLSSIGADAKGQMNSSGVTYTVIAFE